ncbi:MAG: hypothetical protein J7L89_04190 [Bacteroidales bacterium]|nr:hypothetical protein [Bacteroidales bacterium]
MKHKISLLIVSVICTGVLTAQTRPINQLDRKGLKTGYWVKFYPGTTDTLYTGFFVNGHPSGEMVRYHPEGGVRAKLIYDTTGQKVQAAFFDPDGRFRAEGHYLKQKKEGLWIFYSENKTPLYRIHYHNDELNGRAERYNLDTTLIEKAEWHHNQLDGIREINYANGQKQAVIHYRNGIMEGPYITFFPSGKIQSSGQCHQNLREGKWTYFFENGKKDFELIYRHGKVQNPLELNLRQQKLFDLYEKNRHRFKDPEDYRNDPERFLHK